MGSTKLISLFFCLLLIVSTSSATSKKKSRKPCKTLVVYFHDILYNGQNAENKTSAIVAAPAWDNTTILGAEQNHFGDIIVFDDPITLDNNLHSTPIGRAQGLYLYDGKQTFSTWFGFSFLFNSTEHQGIITMAGADPFLEKTREIPVIGGTGDFFMARGIATFMTDAFEGEVYFRIRANITLYECW